MPYRGFFLLQEIILIRIQLCSAGYVSRHYLQDYLGRNHSGTATSCLPFLVGYKPDQCGIPEALEEGQEETVLCACGFVPQEDYFIS